MSGLAEIRRHMWSQLGSRAACVAGVTVQELQQFAGGYITIPEQSVCFLALYLWNGKRKYDPASDRLIDIATAF